jgi:hypothetical protein
MDNRSRYHHFFVTVRFEISNGGNAPAQHAHRFGNLQWPT